MSVVKVKCPVCGSKNVSKNGTSKVGKNNISVIINSAINQVSYWITLTMLTNLK